MTVRWTARARTDLAEIHRFIAGDSPQAAERVVHGGTGGHVIPALAIAGVLLNITQHTD